MTKFITNEESMLSLSAVGSVQYDANESMYP